MFKLVNRDLLIQTMALLQLFLSISLIHALIISIKSKCLFRKTNTGQLALTCWSNFLEQNPRHTQAY